MSREWLGEGICILGISRIFDQDLKLFGQAHYKIWFEMGPYGSVGAHIKTGRSPVAQDHFKTPPDPQKGHGMIKNLKKKN